MNMFEAYQSCISQYATFSGRARRQEYWLFYLCNLLISILLAGLELGIMGVAASPVPFFLFSGLQFVYSLFILIPGLAVTVRRLHDSGHSGAWWFLVFLPAAGPVILLIFLCMDSEPGENQYGLNPKEVAGGPVIMAVPVSAPAPAPAPSFSETLPPPARRAALPPARVQRGSIRGPQIRVTCMARGCNGMSVTGGMVFIGRDPNYCQMVLPKLPGVSKVHCMLHTDGRSIDVSDLNSSYGTYLPNGTRLQANKTVYLQNKSTIYLGSPNVPVRIELIY